MSSDEIGQLATCEWCGDTFIRKKQKRNHRFCSAVCNASGWRRDHPERIKFQRELPSNRDKQNRRNKLRKGRKQKPKPAHQRKAHVAVLYAIKNGLLVRLPCEVCGNPKSQGHHEDYTKQLEVRWLCAYHHKEVHINAR